MDSTASGRTPFPSWRVPARDEIVPVSEAQSCAVCSAKDWSWMYLLLTAPEWVRGLGWFANWFVVMCDDCHDVWERGPADDLVRRWALSEAHDADVSGPNLDEYREVVLAMQSEPPMTRAAATAR